MTVQGLVIDGFRLIWTDVGRVPDFWQFTLNAGSVVGWTGSITVDRYGRLYESPIGVNLGKSIDFVSYSVTPGWLPDFNGPAPPYALEEFLTGWGCSLGGGFGGGGFFQWSSGGQAVSLGAVSPQVGISCGWSYEVHP